MSDEFWKAMAIILPSGFAFASMIVSLKNKGNIKKIHDSINGLLAEKTLADKAIGKTEGIRQEKSDQKDRDDNKK